MSHAPSEPSAPSALTQRPRPANLADLFWSFTWLALQGFGGVLAVVQRELVEKKQWLTHEEFVEDWSVAQVLPGPNVANLGIMIGDRYFGPAGALTALAGLLAFPLLVVLTIAAIFSGISDYTAAQGALRGMGAVASGLITATGFKLLSALKNNVMGMTVCALVAVATFICIALLRIPLATVLLLVGGASGVWAYRQLGLLHNQTADK